VIARNRSRGALDHQRRDLHSIKLSYLTEDRVASTITWRTDRSACTTVDQEHYIRSTSHTDQLRIGKIEVSRVGEFG
jgi:hypothetical protein